MANNHYDLSSIYTAADKYTVLQLLNALLDKVKDLEITDVDVNKTAVNKFKLVFTFVDNTTMETPEFALEYDIVDVDIVDGHLIFTFDGDNTYDAGNLKGVTDFAINSSQHLIVNYQDGTSQDLGAIFNGNITISGNLNVTGNISSFENLCDSQGRKRFVEGSLSIPSGYQGEGLTSTFSKWSLSGTHLMVVFAGTLEADASITTTFASGYIPSWIYDKMVAVYFNKVSMTTGIFGNDYGQTNKHDFVLAKSGGNILIEPLGNYTAGARDENFRVQFDLLIDNT